MSELLGYLPPKLRPVVAGGLMLIAVAGATFAVATFAATQQVTPVAGELAQHKRDQTKREQEYLYPLLEAIWSDQRALCAANPAAKCDGYNPVRPTSTPTP